MLAKSTYLKIYAWLKDPEGLEKLKKWSEKWKCKIEIVVKVFFLIFHL
jgi:hypothetical protein